MDPTKIPNDSESDLNGHYSQRKKNPLEENYRIALYQSVEHGYFGIFQFHGEQDDRFCSGYVRVSDVLTVKFTSLSNDVVIKSAIAALDASERDARSDCERRVAKIRQQKANLLALTYQPATETAHGLCR